MKVGLFIPCYIDQLYPDVGLATVDVLERFGCECVYPTDQTCCGQPMANSGCTTDTKPLAHAFVRIFKDFDYIVAPSGSCVSMVRNHYDEYFSEDAESDRVRHSTYELTEFLVKVLGVTAIDTPFPHKVALHPSCHGLRELRLGKCSERQVGPPDMVRDLLQSMPAIELVELSRHDECCGFGGTFAVTENGVSALMGHDRLRDFHNAGAHVVTATDVSCLMHLDGLARRSAVPLQFMHIAEVFAGRSPTPEQ